MAAAHIQTTKGLYFTFTLLCLVCLASSRMPNDELEEIKLNIKQIQQQQNSIKAEHESVDTSLGFIDDYLNIMEQLEVWLKKSDVPDGFPPLDGIVQNTKDYVEKLKTYLGRGEKIDQSDEEVRNMMKMIKFHEENQAEL